ncbi:Ig-like domain-containing protein [Clostridium novyi]|uniref:Ig-like domain-containing protein n=1 Tax=Clostridium novyi TaxID=1542 RepID=UPI00068A3DBD|nr:Ig-like domain-containing protein [Clostridium novyi]
MKNKIKIIFLTGLLVFGVSNCAIAKEIPQKNTSSLNKSWTIKFNKNLNNKSINNDNIYIKDDKGKKIKTSLFTENNSVTLIPVENYKDECSYTVCVNKGIKGEKNNSLKEDVYMKFNVNIPSKYDILNNPDYYVKYEKFADVNGDGVDERIQTIYKKFDGETGVYSEDKRILIKNNSGNKVLEEIKLDDAFYGIANETEIYDFNRDGVKDIMVPLSTGGSAGDEDYSIYSFKGNELKTLYSSFEPNGVEFTDQYVKFQFYPYDENVHVWCQKYGVDKVLNFSNYSRKHFDTDYEGYFVLFTFKPININSKGEADIETTSYLATDYKEWVAEAKTTYTWDKNKDMWVIKDVKVLPGNEEIYEIRG